MKRHTVSNIEEIHSIIHYLILCVNNRLHYFHFPHCLRRGMCLRRINRNAMTAVKLHSIGRRFSLLRPNECVGCNQSILCVHDASDTFTEILRLNWWRMRSSSVHLRAMCFNPIAATFHWITITLFYRLCQRWSFALRIFMQLDPAEFLSHAHFHRNLSATNHFTYSKKNF